MCCFGDVHCNRCVLFKHTLSVQPHSGKQRGWQSAKGPDSHLIDCRSLLALGNPHLSRTVVARSYWYRVIPEGVVAIPTRHVRKYGNLIHRKTDVFLDREKGLLLTAVFGPTLLYASKGRWGKSEP